MRGYRVYQLVQQTDTIAVPARKGRNAQLLSKRNECLLARYYYYAYMKNKSYADVLKLIVMEFYVSEATIAMLVQDYLDDLMALKKKCPTLYYFNRRWPHIRW